MNSLSGIEATLGKEWMDKILSSKILLVGAGGIGCELLKNLALSGFRNVQVIDLDTIDVSNLNRQFLFRSQHVGQPKCLVASKVALDMISYDQNGNNERFETPAKYEAHHGNVCDNSKFNVQYMGQFDLVLNALDNVTARRRVNRLCLAANKPLVEAGTTGYLGQVKVIHKASGVACYECKTQETQKVYPICTIRSTPSMPVHTIVWAKELYKLLFNPKPEESMLYEDPAGEEPSTYMEAVLAYRKLVADKSTDKKALCDAAHAILTKLSVDEINKQLEMGRYKTAKKTPAPVGTDVLEASTTVAKEGSENSIPSRTQKTTDIWSQQDNVVEFVACLVEAPSLDAILPSFDKDDALAMRLVTASSNLRSSVFGIEPLQSYYSAKGIAGNIIPAIATTNAVIAGLQVLQVFHILKAQLDGKPDSLRDVCRYVDCLRNKTGRPEFYIMSSKLDPPNHDCFVCRNARIPLTLNVNKWTLRDLLDRVLKKDLGFECPTILLNDDIVYEEGEGADASFEVNLDKLLPKLPSGGIQDGTMFRVEDFTQDLEVDVAVTHKEVWEKEEGEGEGDDGEAEKFVVGGEKPVAKAAAAAAGASSSTADGDKKPAATGDAAVQDNGGDDDDDDVEIVVMDVDDINDTKPAAVAGGTKRKANGENGDTADEGGAGAAVASVAKKPKPNPPNENENDNEIIVLD